MDRWIVSFKFLALSDTLERNITVRDLTMGCGVPVPGGLHGMA